MNLSLVYASLQKSSFVNGGVYEKIAHQDIFKKQLRVEEGSSNLEVQSDKNPLVSFENGVTPTILPTPMSLFEQIQDTIPSIFTYETSRDQSQGEDELSYREMVENSTTACSECDSGFADSMVQAKKSENQLSESISDNIERFSGDSFQTEYNTPTRRFPNCSTQLFLAITISCWDNICGPRIMSKWLASDFEIQNDRLLEICRRSLMDELGRDESDGSINMKSFTLCQDNVTVMTYMFNGMTKLGIKVHGVTFILNSANIADFFSWGNVIKRWTQRMIGNFRIHLEKTDGRNKALAFFDEHIPRLIEITEIMERFVVPESIAMTATYLAHQHRPSFSKEELLKDAIISHLTTCGNTLVTGSSEKKINKMILTLALFSSISERKCSRLVCGNGERRWNSYIPDLCIQGLLMSKSSEGSRRQVLSNLPHHDILCSYYPTTIVDMHSRNVWQTHLMDGHTEGRQRLLNREVLDLAYEKKKRGTEKPLVTLFSPDQPETLVTNFIKEVFEIPASSRQDYTLAFVHNLKRKAMLLIRRVEAVVMAKRAGTPNVMRLREEMRLDNEGDFRIILAQAEKLKPGFYSYIVGKTDMSQYSFLRGYAS